MNKKRVVLGILMDLVLLIVFNVIFFAVGGAEHTASIWLSYGFMHFAYIMVILTPLLTGKSVALPVLGMTIAGVSSVYFIIELITGVVFILLNQESIKAALVVQIIIAGIYLVILFMNMIANEATAENLARQQDEAAFIKNASSRVKALMDRSGDKKVNKTVEKAYDLIHSSPAKSNVVVQGLEMQVVNKISDLEGAVSAGDDTQIVSIAGEIISLMEERNRKVKNSR